MRDYGTFIGELSNVINLPENTRTVYSFDKIRNEEMAPSMPEDRKVWYRENLPTTRRMQFFVIESIEPTEVIVYKRALLKGGKRKIK